MPTPEGQFRVKQVHIPELTTLTTDFVIDLLRNKKTLRKGATSTVYKVSNLYTYKGFLALKVINQILKMCKTQIDSQNTKKVWNDEEESDNDLNEENEEEIEIDLDKARVIYSEYELLNNLNHPNIIKVFGITYKICSAMMHIHAHKTIHRDLKSQNILINKCKHVKTCDFGISKVLDATTLTCKNVKNSN